MAQCVVGPSPEQPASHVRRHLQPARRCMTAANPLDGFSFALASRQNRGGVLCRRLSAPVSEQDRDEA
jgi:hypothetical protein